MCGLTADISNVKLWATSDLCGEPPVSSYSSPPRRAGTCSAAGPAGGPSPCTSPPPPPPDLYLERPPKAFIFQLNTKEIQPHDKQIYLFFMIILCTYTIPRAQTQLCVDASRFVEMWGHMTDFRSVILPKTNLWMSAISNSHLLKVVCSGITKVVGSIPASCSHSHVNPKAPKAALVFFLFFATLA